MDHSTRGGFALVGPGRAGTAIAAALVAAGYRCVGVAGRAPDAASTLGLARRLGAPAVAVPAAGRGAGLVVLATPDLAIEAVAADLAPGVEPGALVVHLAGSRGVEALAPIAARRADVELGALHPLQTLIGGPDDSLVGAWAAVSGPPAVARLADQLGLHGFTLDDDRRATYHAAAAVASNHLVALLAQVERLAREAGVPFSAFEPLVRTTVAHGFDLGPRAALTGPVARGDVDTVRRHLDAIGERERDGYRALAEEARRLAGRDEAELRGVLA